MPNPITYVAADFTTSSGAVDAEQLRQEFAGASFSSTPVVFEGITVDDLGGANNVSIFFNAIPDATDEATADALVAAHTALGPNDGLTEGKTEPFGGFGRPQNFLLFSEELDNAVWADPLNNSTVIANNAVAPNGETEADQLTFDSTGLGLRQSNLGLTIGNRYTLSFWARFVSGSNNTIVFDLRDNGGESVTIDTTFKRYSRTIVAGTGGDFLDFTQFVTTGVFEFWGVQLVDEEANHDHPYTKTTDTQVLTIVPGMVATNIEARESLTLNGNDVSPQGSFIVDIFSNSDWPDTVTAPDGETRVPLALSTVYIIHNDIVLPKMLLPIGTDPLSFEFTTFKSGKGNTNLFVDGDLTGHIWGRDSQGMSLFDMTFTDIGNSFAGFSTKLFDLVGLGGATSILLMERTAIFQFKQEGLLVDIGILQTAVQDGFNDSGWTVRSTTGAASAGLVNSLLNSSGLNISAFPDTKHPVFSFIGTIADFAITHYGLNTGKAANSGFYFDQALIGGTYGLTAFSYGGPATHGEFFRPDLALSITAQANADIVITSFADSTVNPGVDTTVNFGTIVDFTRGQFILIADEAAYDGTHEIVRVAADQNSFDINVVFSTAGAGTLKMVQHTVAVNKLTRDETVVITGTTSYNGTAQVLRETDTTFHLPQAFVANDATGTGTSTSLDETSNSLQVAVAGAQKDSKSIGSVVSIGNAVVTTISLINTWTDLNLNSLAVAGSNIERWGSVNSTTGEVTYTGLPDFSGTIIATMSVTSSGGSQAFQFRVVVNGSPTSDAVVSSVDLSSAPMVVVTLIAPISIVTSDVVRLQTQNTSGTADVLIQDLSYEIS